MEEYDNEANSYYGGRSDLVLGRVFPCGDFDERRPTISETTNKPNVMKIEIGQTAFCKFNEEVFIL
jgi:hypothetical protein